MNGATEKSITGTASANGMHVAYAMDVDGDGYVDLTRQTDVSWQSATAAEFQGGRIDTIREVYATGRAAYLETRLTSADGLKTKTTFDINGDGKIDGQSTSTTTLNADGSKGLAEVTNYTSYDAGGALVVGALRSSHTISTSADARTLTVRDDFDGNGLADKTEVTRVGADGSRVTTETSFGQGGMPGQTFVTTTTSDGLLTTIARSGNLQTITRSTVDNGTYSWDDGVTADATHAHTVVSHEVDSLGIETWSVTDQLATIPTPTITTISVRLDQAAKALVLSEAAKIYDTVLDRGLDMNEGEVLARFVVGGQLDRLALTTALVNSAEFGTRYGTTTLSDAEFVAQVYLNGFGRGTTLTEMDAALHDLQVTGLTRAAFALNVNDSVEHDVVGNGHLSTNNFDVIMNPVVFERSLDRVYVENLVHGIVDTFYDREPTASESAYFVDCLLKDTKTVNDIVTGLLNSDSDTQGNGSHSLFFHKSDIADFITQAFQNGLGRGPSAAELQDWTDNLNAGRLTKAQFIMTVAQSIDHDAAINLHNAIAGGSLIIRDGSSADDMVSGGSTSDWMRGFAGADTLNASGGADQLYGGTGNDSLNGGSGSDRYFWVSGDGSDTVNDDGSSRADTDSAEFAGISSSAVTFSRASGSNDLVLTFQDTATGGQAITMTVVDEFKGGTNGNGIERFVFADKVIARDDLIDGTNGAQRVTLDAQNATLAKNYVGSGDRDQLIGGQGADTLAGGAGNDSLQGKTGADLLQGSTGDDLYTWVRGDGADVIDDTGTSITEIDRLVLSGVVQADVSLSRVAGTNDILLTVAGTGGAGLVIKNRLAATDVGKGIEVIQFGDASIWSLDDITSRVASSDLAGTPYADRVTGAAAAETLSGGASGDTMSGGAGAVADLLKGEAGADTYLWSKGMGNDTIDDSSALLTESDTLDLTGSAGVASTDATLKLTRGATAADLTITVGSEVLTVKNEFGNPNKGWGIERIAFADGVIWSLQDIISRTEWHGTAGDDAGNSSIAGSAFDDNIYGDAGNDSISGGSAGDDNLTGGTGNDTLVGGSGSDRYVWSSGDGNDLIVDTGNGAHDVDTLVMGLASSTATLSKSGNDLLVSLQGGAVLTVKDRFTNSGTGVEFITFADGVVIEVLDDPIATVIRTGTAGNDSLTGWAFRDALDGGVGNDTLNANAGDDTLTGGVGNDSLMGGAGNDTYVWATSDGNDTVNDTVSGHVENDTLILTDVTSAAVVLVRDSGSADLRLSAGSSSGMITIAGQYSSTLNKGIETIVFADGVTWQLDDIYDHATVSAPVAGGTIAGTIFRDRMVGSAAADTLNASDGNDTLTGYGGNDSLAGGNGCDTYVWGHDAQNAAIHDGNDTINDTSTSLAETDILDLSMSVSSAQALLTRALGSDNLQITDTVSGATITILNQFNAVTSGYGIELIKFSDDVVWTLDDILSHTTAGLPTQTSAQSVAGTSFRDQLLGGIGNDTLIGKAGDDTLSGGKGNDILFGDDTTSGGLGPAPSAGNDTYLWSKLDGNDTIKDLYTSTNQIDTLNMSSVQSSDVYLSRSAGTTDLVVRVASLAAPGGYEYITVIQQYSSTNVGDGIERIILADATWTLNDLLARVESWAPAQGAGNDSLVGTSYQDNLFTGAGNDSVYGGNGDDRLEGGAGSDLLFGGNGIDLARYSTSTHGVSIDLGLTTQAGAGDENGDVFTGIEGVEGSAFNDTLTGSSSANILYGMAGDDLIRSLNGYDSVFGGAGDDSIFASGIGGSLIDGGTGIDAVSYADATGAVGADLMLPVLGWGGALSDTFHGVENLIGSAFDDVLAGVDRTTTDPGRNMLWGGDGNDLMFGRSGDDTLYGGNGDDRVNGEGDNDLIYGDAGNDSLDGSTGLDTLDGGTGNDTLLGGDGEDSLLGGDNDDRIFGGIGNDLIYGGAGYDTIDAGDGNDTVYGDNGLDVITLGTGNDVFYDNSQNDANGHDSVDGGAGNDTLNGDGGNDTLLGGDGDDSASGGIGNDVLTGGTGNDILAGGAGADHFIYTSGSSGTDTITDFNELDGGAEEFDVLEFRSLLVGTFVYRGASAFTGGSDNSEARISGAQLLIDTNGDGTADITINMTGLTAASQISASDFLWS